MASLTCTEFAHDCDSDYLPKTSIIIHDRAQVRNNRQMPSETTTNTIEVDSVDAFLEKITEAGGKVIAPKMPIPGVGYFAMCLDTEGNPFGLMEDDPDAK
jgi:hypothetical protein